MLKHYIGYADYYTRVRFEFDSEPENAKEKARDLAFTSGMDEATTKLEVERVRCEPYPVEVQEGDAGTHGVG